MEVSVMVRIDRDDGGGIEEPVVRVFSTPEAAKDAMRNDLEAVKRERYPRAEDVYVEMHNPGSDRALLAGVDGTDSAWIVKSATVEGRKEV